MPAVHEALQEEVDFSQRRPAQRRLLTVKQLVQAHPCFTEGGLRWFLFHRETNGLKQAVVRVGRKLLLDESRFFEWVDAQNATNGK